MAANASSLVARHSLPVERDELQVGMAVLLAASAAIHFAVTPAHFGEYVAFGAFFLVCAVLQFAAAAACLYRASRTVVCAAAVLSATVALVWLTSRTVGLPIGPNPGRPERVGLGDVVATLYELAAVATALPLIARLRPRAVSRARVSARLSTVAALLGWVTVGAMITGH